ILFDSRGRLSREDEQSRWARRWCGVAPPFSSRLAPACAVGDAGGGRESALATSCDSLEYLGDRTRKSRDDSAAVERVTLGEPGHGCVVGNGQYRSAHRIDEPDESSARRRVVADLLLER